MLTSLYNRLRSFRRDRRPASAPGSAGAYLAYGKFFVVWADSFPTWGA